MVVYFHSDRDQAYSIADFLIVYSVLLASGQQFFSFSYVVVPYHEAFNACIKPDIYIMRSFLFALFYFQHLYPVIYF